MVDDLKFDFHKIILHLHVIRHLNGKRKKGIECRRLSKIVRATLRHHALRYFQRRIHSFEFAAKSFCSIHFLARNANFVTKINFKCMKNYFSFKLK